MAQCARMAYLTITLKLTLSLQEPSFLLPYADSKCATPLQAARFLHRIAIAHA
jgi:hypothetical protein